MKTAQIRSRSTRRTVFLVAGAAGAAFLAMLALLYVIDTGGQSAQDVVPTGGANLAPLDPARTVSLFQIFTDGGLQQVMAAESDPAQVASIQAYLKEQAKKFSSGDFSDAARVHSEEMAWLGDLKAGAGRIEVRYEALPNGGQIRYTAAEPALVSALQNWLMAQASHEQRQVPVH